MMEHYKLLINGQWVESSNKDFIPTTNPFSQETWAYIAQASEEDVEKAIEAANSAFEKWKNVSGKERALMLLKLADVLEENAERMAILESKDNGKVIRETLNQMHFAARNYRFFAGYADKIYGETIPLDNMDLLNYTLRKPLGVAALITSWNSPITILANKLAPALAAGNTVIIKPSEYTSVTTLEFGKLLQEAGFPDGVVNIVTGDAKVGDYLTKSSKIQKISFTGGTSTGKIISKNASENLVANTLELGGKSPNIVFEDANLEAALTGAIAGIFGASGQTCIAGSRLLVQKSIYEDFVQKVVTKARSIKLGDPLNPETEMGPVANESQFKRINESINRAKKEGAKQVLGADSFQSDNPELSKGYFVPPTIFADVDNNSFIAKEEVFGPVLSIIPFEDDKNALEIANESEYGLAAGIWTSDLQRAHRLSNELQAGTIWVNTYRTSAAQAPFGGVKMSGRGKERGWHALLEYTQVKNVMINLSNNVRDPFTIQS